MTADCFDLEDEPRPEITMMGDKIFYGDLHVATVEDGLPGDIAEEFSIELLNGVKAAENVADFMGYHRAIFDISRFEYPAIKYLKDYFGAHVRGFIFPKARK